MQNKIRLLDCTLRDGAYVTEGNFGSPAICGIIRKMQEAHIDIIECGWLKDAEYKPGTSFFHQPCDIENYLPSSGKTAMLVAMIDWDRYNVDNLPDYDGKSIDAIRIVFPHGKHREGIEIGQKIRQKGYHILFQAANTLAYNEDDLKELAESMNAFHPLALSVVDTFGAMYPDDLKHILEILDKELNEEIKLGFHAHNNQQLAFALCVEFVKSLSEGTSRDIIVDASLSGMGRGAGNAATELIANYLNRKCYGNYDMNVVMDAIDTYMQGFHETYTWGYSTPYFIAGIYQCHVNNISYLLDNHRTNAKDMRNIIESLSKEERRKYDFDLLERRYLENQNRVVDDSAALGKFRSVLEGRQVLLLAPGKSLDSRRQKIQSFIETENPIVIAVNAIHPGYEYDFAFFTNFIRYEYAKVAHPGKFGHTRKIIMSNIKTEGSETEWIINFNLVVKRGWKHFDNAVILCLRMMNKIGVPKIHIAGFDGFKTAYNENYFDPNLPTLNPDNQWEGLNREIRDMFYDFKRSTAQKMELLFLTESIFE